MVMLISGIAFTIIIILLVSGEDGNGFKSSLLGRFLYNLVNGVGYFFQSLFGKGSSTLKIVTITILLVGWMIFIGVMNSEPTPLPVQATPATTIQKVDKVVDTVDAGIDIWNSWVK